jgi:hypothetical protein
VVVGRLDAIGVGEGPQRRPALEEALGEEAVVLRPQALAGRVLEQRSELCLQRRNLGLETSAVVVLLAPPLTPSPCGLTDRHSPNA